MPETPPFAALKPEDVLQLMKDLDASEGVEYIVSNEEERWVTLNPDQRAAVSEGLKRLMTEQILQITPQLIVQQRLIGTLIGAHEALISQRGGLHLMHPKIVESYSVVINVLRGLINMMAPQPPKEDAQPAPAEIAPTPLPEPGAETAPVVG